MKIAAIVCVLILLACAITMHPLVFAIGCPIAAILIVYMLYIQHEETAAVCEKLDALSEKNTELQDALYQILKVAQAGTEDTMEESKTESEA